MVCGEKVIKETYSYRPTPCYSPEPVGRNDEGSFITVSI